MNRYRPFSDEEFKNIYSKVPRLTVEVILKKVDAESGKPALVLMLRKEASWHGQWHIPGGTVIYDEYLAQTVQRIAREELGVEVKMNELVGYIHYPSEQKERGFGWSVGIAFLCEVTSEPDEAMWKENGIEWFMTLPENLVEEQREILEKVLHGSR